MNSCNRIVFALGIAVVGVWFARRRLRFDAPLSAREWHEDPIGRDDLAG